MGLFDSKKCGLCGAKAGMLSKQKLSDGFLCSDCKKKLSSLSSGWKELTLRDANEHLEAREKNRDLVSQFRTTRAAGNDQELEIDDTNQWFRFNIGRDARENNQQIFSFSEFVGLHVEVSFDPFSDDSDGDGIPDHLDTFDDAADRRNFSSTMNAAALKQQVNVMGLSGVFRYPEREIDENGYPKEVEGYTVIFNTNNRFFREIRVRFSGGFHASSNLFSQVVEVVQTGLSMRGGMPGQMGVMPGQMGGMPGQMGVMPGQMGVMPGQMGGVPGQMGVMPGQMGGVPQNQQGIPNQSSGYVNSQTCPQCGTPVTGKFCTGCGYSL